MTRKDALEAIKTKPYNQRDINEIDFISNKLNITSSN